MATLDRNHRRYLRPFALGLTVGILILGGFGGVAGSDRAAPAAPLWVAAGPTVLASGGHTPVHVLPNPLPTNQRLPSGLFPTAYPIGPGHHLLGAPRPVFPSHRPSTWGDGSGGTFPGSDYNWSLLNESCYGIWPGSQNGYEGDCYGHDEPGLDPYSTLPGSGGNATWVVTLPTERSPTQNQSNLYAAIWFGLTLTDPFGWLDECFLELQFYPDSSFTASTTVYDHWEAAAVAWQIEAITGAEDACFYQPLVLDSNPGIYLNMSGGDTVRVVENGWQGSPYGENLSIVDVTSGSTSTVHMYNSYQGYPLDPAYSTNSYPNSLQWTSGGELPVSFAFETGHANYAFPENNSYGGCSAGVPPPTPQDPATPCPSYDPGYWINDTVTPWEIHSPVFYNAQSTDVASEVTFSQDLGGITFIDPISSGSCTGRDGSAFCTYPWFSYSCGAQAFEFGATDWPGVSDDFGQYNEYSRATVTNDLNSGYYTLSPHAMPACGAAIDPFNFVSNGGTIGFLGTTWSGSGGVFGFLPGNYSISASPSGSNSFDNWSTTGGYQVSDPTLPSPTLWIDGSGTLTAHFGPAVPKVPVTFDDLGLHGRVQVVAGFTESANSTNFTVPNGATLALAPGIYSICALPDPGYNFTSWSSNSTGGALAAPGFPFTWLTVSGEVPSITVSAAYAASTSTALVLVYVLSGLGTVYFDGTAEPSGAYLQVPVGTYTIAAVASPGYTVAYWGLSGIAAGIISTDPTNATVENGTSYLEVYFLQLADLTVVDVGPNGTGASATVQFDGIAAYPNGTTLPVEQYGPSYYGVVATAPAGSAFVRWTSSTPSELRVFNPTNASATILLNGSATLTATFGPPTIFTNLTVHASPAGAGSIELGNGEYSAAGATSSLTVPKGTYLLEAAAHPGYSFAGWRSNGSAIVLSYSTQSPSVPQNLLVLNAGNGSLTAVFFAVAAPAFPVSFYTNPVGGQGWLNGTPVSNGETLYLQNGSYSIGVNAFAEDLEEWFSTSNLSTSGPFGNTTTLIVNGSGSVYVVGVGPFLLELDVSPISGGAPLNVSLAVDATGGGGPSNVTWTFGDGTPDGYGPSQTHDYATPGTYPLSVLADDGAGGTVGDAVFVDVIGVTESVASGPGPLSVTFGTTIVGGPGGYGYLWDFGDGSPATTSPTPTHTFNSVQTFVVRVTVTTAVGVYAVATTTVQVLAPLTLLIGSSAETGRVPLTVNVTATPSGGTAPYSINWTFGDGATATGLTAAHTYASAGTYVIGATVTDAHGFTTVAEYPVYAVPAPLAGSLALGPTSITLGESFRFSAQATGGLPPFTYDWSVLPTGCDTQNLSTLDCTPSAAGDFPVHVTISDPDGQSVSLTGNVSVSPAGSGNSPNAGGSLPAWELGALIGAVGIVVIGILLIALRARSRPPNPPTSPPASGPP